MGIEQNQLTNEVAKETPKATNVQKSNQSSFLPTFNSNQNSLTCVNLFDEKQLAQATVFLEKVMRSDKGGFKTINEGLAIMMRAQDLNMPFSTAIEHIHVISGKTGVDIHIIKALLSRAGVTWRCLNDYSPLYEYTDGINVYIDNKLPDYVERCKSRKEAEEKQSANKDNDVIYIYPVLFYQDFNKNLYKSYQLDNRYSIVNTVNQAAEVTKTGKIPIYRVPNQPVDFITKYEFTRINNGKEITAISSFTYTDALTASMFDKDTYKKYPKVLIGHRAFTYGARDIASDIIMGCMETTELKIVAGKELDDAEIVDFEEVRQS